MRVKEQRYSVATALFEISRSKYIRIRMLPASTQKCLGESTFLKMEPNYLGEYQVRSLVSKTSVGFGGIFSIA